jgi:hypothetical protein
MGESSCVLLCVVCVLCMFKHSDMCRESNMVPLWRQLVLIVDNTNDTTVPYTSTMFDSLHMSECLNIHNTQTTHNNTHDDSPIPQVNPLLSGGVNKSSTWALNLSIVERQLVLIVDNNSGIINYHPYTTIKTPTSNVLYSIWTCPW